MANFTTACSTASAIDAVPPIAGSAASAIPPAGHATAASIQTTAAPTTSIPPTTSTGILLIRRILHDKQ